MGTYVKKGNYVIMGLREKIHKSHAKNKKEETMKFVRILNGRGWYTNRVGHKYELIEKENYSEKVYFTTGGTINKLDGTVVDVVQVANSITYQEMCELKFGVVKLSNGQQHIIKNGSYYIIVDDLVTKDPIKNIISDTFRVFGTNEKIIEVWDGNTSKIPFPNQNDSFSALEKSFSNFITKLINYVEETK